jgi:hypothetical protein
MCCKLREKREERIGEERRRGGEREEIEMRDERGRERERRR